MIPLARFHRRDHDKRFGLKNLVLVFVTPGEDGGQTSTEHEYDTIVFLFSTYRQAIDGAIRQICPRFRRSKRTWYDDRPEPEASQQGDRRSIGEAHRRLAELEFPIRLE